MNLKKKELEYIFFDFKAFETLSHIDFHGETLSHIDFQG